MTSEIVNELTDSEKLGELALVYNAMDGVINSIYDALNATDHDTRRNQNKVYGLVIAMQILSEKVGTHTGVI